jgi:hypothetical protein
MLLYQSICYLQNHKTGSTFVDEFLLKHCKEPLRHHQKHAVVITREPQVWYFTNVREPVALYRSLYAYGVDGRGEVYERLCARGRADLYAATPDGFTRWLTFILAPQNAPYLHPAYTSALASMLGFMSWRFLRLACLHFQKNALSITNGAQLATLIRNTYFINTVLRQETLRGDLTALVTNQLKHAIRDVPAALEWITRAANVNTSSASERPASDFDTAATRELIAAREVFLYKNFYKTPFNETITINEP